MKISRLVIAAAMLGPLLWLFGPALVRPESFVFRDAAHFYFPLFQWTCGRWAEGELPLWNPQENCGIPLTADTSSSLFYPGKLLFVLPLSYALRFKLYTIGHVLLAAVGAAHVGRRWGASGPAAAAGGLCYGYSGSVVFQYCNVVYLVGAAWLPWSLLAANTMLTRRSLPAAVRLGAVWALMTLGGDPQAAYHSALLTAGYAVLLGRAGGRRGRLPQGSRAETPRRWRLLATAALSGAVLSAVQLIPAVDWARRSERAAFRQPRSLYEVPAAWLRRGQAPPPTESGSPTAGAAWSAAAHGLFGEPLAGDHHRQLYQFSTGPWRFAELLWPNLGGRLFPINRRWFSAIPAEGRVWTPSLYMGLLPLLSACSVWRVRRGPPRVRWLSASALWFALASCGWYGLGWLLHELRYAAGHPVANGGLGAPVGGLYWLMVTALPGYVQFRYPAKLTVVATLSFSLLAARGWDRLFRGDRRRLRTALAVLAVLSGTALAGTALGGTAAWQPQWRRWLAAASPDAVYGPLQADGAMSDLRGALWHTAVVCVLLWLLLRWGAGRRSAPLLALLLTAAELSCAHGWLTPAAPTRLWRQTPWAAAAIQADDRGAIDGQPYRVFRASQERWAPRQWSQEASTQRQSEAFAWERHTLMPKLHLDVRLERGQPLALAESFSSIAPLDFQTFWRVARERGIARGDGRREPHRALLDALGVRYMILPDKMRYAATEAVAAAPPRAMAAPPDARLWRNPSSLPRAWIVHEVAWLPPLATRDPAAIERRTREVLFPSGRPRDFRQTAVVEAAAAAGLRKTPPRGAVSSRCRVVRYAPQRVEIEAELASDGLLVLSDLYAHGWIAEVTSGASGAARRVEILRANRIMRGVSLPAGRHRVVFRYRPAGLYFGLALSGAGWLIVTGGCLLGRGRTRATPEGKARAAGGG